MATVIVGGGIIGFSIAYYLSEKSSVAPGNGEIHIIESSSQLFSSASGYAAGFLAENWFGTELAPLGGLSFRLHRELAAVHGGAQKWGYMSGAALSLEASETNKCDGDDDDGHAARGDDWLRAGTSRGDAAAGRGTALNTPGAPAWLTDQKGTRLRTISESDSVAQVDPLRLCRFLANSSVERGVCLHQPAKVTAVVTDEGSRSLSGVTVLDCATQAEMTLPCKKLILCGGPWTPQIFKELFPESKLAIPISPLAGYSLVVRSPRHTMQHERELYQGRSHAIFTTLPSSCGFCPEIFSREGAEIYIAGLNSTAIPLPARAEDAHLQMAEEQIGRLRDVAVHLMGNPASPTTASGDKHDDLAITRTGLCFRPVSATGNPIVSQVCPEMLGLSGADDAGVFIASGHGPWGISLSLGTGKVIAELVQGAMPSVDITGLGL